MTGNNSFGRAFTWTTFGESHGSAMGVVIDGCPAGVNIDIGSLQKALARRRPGQIDATTGQVLVSERNEMDEVEFLSGVFEGKTLGTPIACIVRNSDQRPQDYEKIKSQPRIGHADDTWSEKFGIADHRGGGRASARETVTRVIAGNIAEQFLKQVYPELKVTSFVKSIGEIVILSAAKDPGDNALSEPRIRDLLIQAKKDGESYGGIVETHVDFAPKGLGEPVFNKIKNTLASAMMSIGATTGFEFGGGFDLTRKKGTEVHTASDSEVYGGIRGGITTGERIVFRVAFKPTSSIKDTAKAGRHDPCIVPRAVPVVEAMTWAVLADLELLKRSNRV